VSDSRNQRRRVPTSNPLLKELQTDKSSTAKAPEGGTTGGEIHTLEKTDLGPEEKRKKTFTRDVFLLGNVFTPLYNNMDLKMN
jgi:hypothetical protein